MERIKKKIRSENIWEKREKGKSKTKRLITEKIKNEGLEEGKMKDKGSKFDRRKNIKRKQWCNIKETSGLIKHCYSQTFFFGGMISLYLEGCFHTCIYV